MVRDSTHRPRNTNELLIMADKVSCQQDYSAAGLDLGETNSSKVALSSFFSTSTDGGEDDDEEEDSDGDTIVQLKDTQSLDEEIQSTIDQLQRNSLTLREAEAHTVKVHYDCQGDLSGDKEEDRSHQFAATTSTSASIPVSTTLITDHQESTIQGIPAKTTDSIISNENTAPTNRLFSKASSCLFPSEPRGTRNKYKTVSDLGVPTFDKNRPLFSESVKHMQRWRNLQGKHDRGDGISFPQTEDAGSSLFAPSSNIERERAKSDAGEGNLKFPRPRSWVSNLLSVGSNSNLARLATTPIARQRHHSFDDQPRQEAGLMPVSSLVLQDEFYRSSREAPVQSLGNLQAASHSTPDLSSPQIESSAFSRRKPAPLLVRNLDSAPRGYYTPSMPFAEQPLTSVKKMNNPWNAFEQELNSRTGLIDPEEEESMIQKAVAERRRHGALAGEERAVLDMLDEMNDSVDTFDRPTVSRAQSRATSSLPRLQTSPSKYRQAEAPQLRAPSISPTRLSVKAFANSLDQNDATSRSSSPIRDGRSSPVRISGHFSAQSSNGESSIGRQGGVRKVIEEREKLDLGLKMAGNQSSLGRNRGSSLLSPPADTLSARPSRAEYLRQDSTSTVSSYASQTNAFLNRRATHAADKQITHSPSLSYVSSGQGSSTTFWSKKGYTTESPFTSPDLPTGSDDKTAFHFGNTRTREADDRPFFRRMMTDETGVTSLESAGESPSPSKQSSMSHEATSPIQSNSPVHAIDFATKKQSVADTRPPLFHTLFKAKSQAGSTTSTGLQHTISTSLITTPKAGLANLDAAFAEGNVSPGKSGSPKKGAKDLIRFYEQNSAPSSPHQSPSRNRSNTPVALRQFKEALGTSVYTNQPGSASPAAQMDAKINEQASLHSPGQMLIAAGAEEKQSNREDSDPFGNEENLPSTAAMRWSSNNRASRQASGSFFGKVLKAGSLPLAGVESTESGDSSVKRVGSSPFKSGMSRLVTALTPSASRASYDGADAEGRSQVDSFGVAPVDSAENAQQADSQSAITSRSIGTTKSFRQTTQVNSDVDPQSAIDMIGEPGATPFRTGLVYYCNVHAYPPTWQWAQAVLLPSALALSWIPAGGGRVSVVLDLIACREVHSVPGPDHPSSLDDVGAIAAREQRLNRISPWQLIFDDGVERLAVESARDRLQWVNAVWDALDATRSTAHERQSAEHTFQVDTGVKVDKVESILTAPSLVGPAKLGQRQSDATIVQTGMTRSRSRPVLVEKLPPSLPPKTGREKSAVDYVEAAISTNAQKHSREVSVEDTYAMRDTPVASNSQETFVSASSEQEDETALEIAQTPETIYLPRTPRSRAMFNWSKVESEIHPSDSASQRPARSQTNSSRYTAIVREKDGKALESVNNTKRTVAQTIRDGVMGSTSGVDESKKTAITGLRTLAASSQGVGSLNDAANDVVGSVPWARKNQLVLPQPNPQISQSIQTAPIEDRSAKSSDLGAVLEAIKDTERTNLSQQSQQGDIARYLNDLNSWLEKDVTDRSKEWRTLALGITQLHEELNAIKTETALRAVEDANRSPVANVNGHRLEYGPGAALAYSAGVDGTVAAHYPYPQAPIQVAYADPMEYSSGIQGLGLNAPAPINSPGPSQSFKRSGTRTWRAEASAGALRNNDAFGEPVQVRDKKKEKADQKAEGRARRRDALKESGVARMAAAAAGAALIAAATHEYDKHKERQRSAGKPEEASSDVDEKSGTFVHHNEIPEGHLGKITEAVVEGDEGKVREAVKHAAEAGAGAAAIQKLMSLLKGKSGEDEGKEENAGDLSIDEQGLPKSTHDSQSEGSRTAKSSGMSLISSDGSASLREAAKVVGAGAGGGALALAVEEILKHLLEKKEEEKNKAKEEAQAEAAREAKRKEEEEAREKALLAQREQDKNDLVETILTKLKQEKAAQEAEAAAKQKELDPKSAIENLVAAINQQRATDGAHHASADIAIKHLAADLVRTHSEQNGKMVEAVNAAAREMLRHNVEAHAEDLKKILSKEVSVMFDDVGKIREAKRALEHEISDLFSIKARHLAGVTKSDTAEAPKPVAAPPQQPAPAWGQPILASPSKPKPLPIPMPMPPAAAMPRRDLVGPFSMSFGPRR